MIHFEWPWALLFLPLPWLFRQFLTATAPDEEAALHVPFMDAFGSETTTGQGIPWGRGLFWLGIVAWLLLVIASVRPQWRGAPVALPVSGRNLMLAVDLSGSMEAKDFKLNGEMVDRLTATQAVAGKFIDRRVGDRLGLILFGKQAYLQTPLTFDRETLKTLLYEAVIGLAGRETAIGDAIGLAVKRLKKQDKDAGERVLILLTDGANTAGEIEPLKAAELAATEDLKIYTIGIGADEMTVRSFFGTQKINPSADLDETTLKGIAAQTGGRYFRAKDTGELDDIYRMLDELEPVEQEEQIFRPTTALYPWPLGGAVLLAALILMGKRFSH